MTYETWGMRFNEHSSYPRVRKGERPAGCPEWFESRQIQIWQEQGLILWNNIDRKIESLHGAEALMLLDELNSRDTWKVDGVSVTRLVHEIELKSSPTRKRKKGDPEPEAEKPKWEKTYKEIIHLPPEAGYALIELLESKKQIISKMAEDEKKRFTEAMSQVWDRLIAFSREKELREFDFKARSFEWQSDGASRMICHYQTAEGRIWSTKDKYFWNTCVKREGHSGNSHHFVKLVEAVDWVESEIIELANAPDVQQKRQVLSKEEIQENRNRLKEKLINGPYWIDPVRMEPQRRTYRILIDLEAKPISYKKFETICGDTYEYADRYPTPSKLANDLSLDASQFQIEQPIGEHSDLYRITSLTSYFQEAVAAEQAQKAWNQSRVLQQFKAGEIIRGRFGYQEVETEFITLLGACGQTAHVWHEDKNRSDFIEWKALRESLSYALDVNDYRDFLGVSTEFINDERLLEFMHETRGSSKFVPDEARRESKIWLAQHKPLD